MNNIYLCGFMGSGKSVIGEKLAKLSKKNFIDLDNMIVKKCGGMSIPNIFAEYSEEYFRQMETQALKSLCDVENAVVSLGGGTLQNPQNVLIANNGGIIIYLKVDFKTCMSRISGDTNRPLLIKHTQQELEALYESRCEIYDSVCSISYEANKSVEQCAADILQLCN